MIRSTFSLLITVIIVIVLADDNVLPPEKCKHVCSRNADCKIVEGRPSCVCKPGWTRLNDGEPCYYVCRYNYHCADEDYCTDDHQCKPRCKK